jgi:hypothetical protein
MDKNIYPAIRVQIVTLKGGSGYLVGDSIRVTMESFLRKKHRGKYYLQRVWREDYVPINADNFNDLIVDGVNRFHADVYRALILGKVSIKLEYPDHLEPVRKMFELDHDQRSEEERLMEGIKW